MDNSSLAEQIPVTGQKRTHEMRAKELEPKLSSKKDWFDFLENNL